MNNKDLAKTLRDMADKLDPVQTNIPKNLTQQQQTCVWDQIMKDPNNWGKPFGLVCTCPKCSPKGPFTVNDVK